MNLNVGCGEEVIRRKDWENVDIFNPLPGLLPIKIMDITKLDYADDSIDRIISSHSIEHLEEPLKALKEWHRILKPGGTLVIATPNNERRSEWIGFHLATLDQRKDRQHLEDHHVEFTPVSLVNLMLDAGPWSILELADPKEFWELPSKATWQICARGIK